MLRWCLWLSKFLLRVRTNLFFEFFFLILYFIFVHNTLCVKFITHAVKVDRIILTFFLFFLFFFLRLFATASSSKTENYIACQRPILDPFDPAMMSFVKKEPPLVCDEEEDWVTIKGNIARITDRALKKYGDVQCKFMGKTLGLMVIISR